MTAIVNRGINFKRILLVTGTLLLIPLLGRWPWSLVDFVIMGVMLSVTGLALDFVSRKVNKDHRLIAAALIVTVFLLVWAQLAVGLIEKILGVF